MVCIPLGYLSATILFACYCGMRRGEIFALIYNDIDFDNNLVKVTKALGVTEQLSYELKTPKSYAGYRDIDIPVHMMERILKMRRARNLYEQTHDGTEPTDEELAELAKQYEDFDFEFSFCRRKMQTRQAK